MRALIKFILFFSINLKDLFPVSKNLVKQLLCAQVIVTITAASQFIGQCTHRD